jgi:hypothetical protein
MKCEDFCTKTGFCCTTIGFRTKLNNTSPDPEPFFRAYASSELRLLRLADCQYAKPMVLTKA